MRQPKTRTEEEKKMIQKYYNFLTARQNQRVWERIFIRVKNQLKEKAEPYKDREKE